MYRYPQYAYNFVQYTQYDSLINIIPQIINMFAKETLMY